MEAAPEVKAVRHTFSLRPLAILLASTILLAVFVALGAGSAVYLVAYPGAEMEAAYSEQASSQVPPDASSSTTNPPPDTTTTTLPPVTSTSSTTTSTTVPSTTSSTSSTTSTTLCGGRDEPTCATGGSCLPGYVANSYGYCVSVECGRSVNSGMGGCGGQVLSQESDWCLPGGTDLFKTRRAASMQ